MGPTTVDQWIDVAKERSADACSLSSLRPGSVCCVYIAGYAVECYLKAYLQCCGKRFRKSGPGGHNLRSLWADSDFQLSDLQDDKGDRTFYINQWSTDLRYEVQMEAGGLEFSQLVDGARKLCGWLNCQIRRRSKRRWTGTR